LREISVLQVALPATEKLKENDSRKATVRLVPYFAWNNRGIGWMIVWFPTGKAEDSMATASASTPEGAISKK
jgi:hypothetical protein